MVNHNLSNIIKLGKDVTKNEDTTGVVYQFSCKNCSAVYIGETKRALKDRISDHIHCKNKNSVVSKHILDDHSFDFSNVKILDREHNYRKRIISEMLHISKYDNTLNLKEDTQFLSSIYKRSFCLF